MAGAGDDKTTRGECVASSLFDVVLLAGDEGFINFGTSLFDAGVDEDLVAEFEDEKVAVDDGAGGDLARFAVSDDGGVLFGSETHFVDSFFGTNGVNDTN